MELKFNEDMECIIWYRAAEGETSLSIAEGVRAVGCEAFRDCRSLEAVTFPDSMTEIHSEAFRNAGLRVIRLPESEVCISASAFMGCRAHALIIPAGFRAMLYDSISKSRGDRHRRRMAFYEEHRRNDVPEPRHIVTKWDNWSDPDDWEVFDAYTVEREVHDEEYWDRENEGYYGRQLRTNFEPWEKHPAPYRGLGFIAYTGHVQEIVIEGGHPYYALFDGALYDKQCRRLIAVPPAKSDTLTLPASLRELCIAADLPTYFYRLKGEEDDDPQYDGFGSLHLREVRVEEGNPCFAAYDGALYDRALTKLLYVPREKSSIQYPPTLREIGAFAFLNSCMKEIHIPEGVERIGEHCFLNRRVGLTVHLPESLRFMGERALQQGCAVLRSHGRELKLFVNQQWETDDTGNWTVLRLLYEPPEGGEHYLQELHTALWAVVLPELYALHPTCGWVREQMDANADTLAEFAVSSHSAALLERLLSLHGLSASCADQLIERTNRRGDFEMQMILMHGLSKNIEERLCL